MHQCHGIALDDTNVRDSTLFELCEQPADTGCVDLDGKDPNLRMFIRLNDGGITHAESDVENHRRITEVARQRDCFMQWNKELTCRNGCNLFL